MELYYFITGVLKRHSIRYGYIDILSISDEECTKILDRCMSEHQIPECEIIVIFKGETYLPLCIGKYHNSTLTTYERCQMSINMNEVVATIKRRGINNSRLVPMPGQSPVDGFYQLEILENASWVPLVTGIKKTTGEDILKTVSNRVILG